MNNGDMPASPIIGNQLMTINNEIAYGLTKREYFAGMALNLLRERIGDGHSAQIATQCVEMADALLEELEK